MARRILAVVLAAAVVLVAAGYGFRGEIAAQFFERLAKRRLAERPLAGLPDGLHVGLCGAGSPLPDERRSGPCTLVIAGQRVFLFDTGSAAARNVARMGFNPGDVEAVFLTHFHSDHIDGLGEVMLQRWAGGAHANPLPVHGPRGVDAVVEGFVQAYVPDGEYRVAHHGEQVVPRGGFGAESRSFDLAGAEQRAVVLSEPDLEVVAFRVEHAPVDPAVGYRIRYKDRTAVLSGDTSKSAAVARESRGVDLLVHEALSPRLVRALEFGADAAGSTNLAKVFSDIPGYHTTPEEAAGIARDAGVGFLLLNHIVPTLPFPGLEQAFLGDAPAIFGGTVRVGVDGDFVTLPAGSRAIEVGARP